MKRLAFVGAFNPPTIAHIEAANLARLSTNSEEVLFIPSRAHYITGAQQKSFAFQDAQRVEMLQAVARENPWMSVCTYELQQTRQPRTYETLCYLNSIGQPASLLFGSDKLAELEHGWKHVREIAEQFGMVVMSRNHTDVVQQISSDPYLSTLRAYITVVPLPETYQEVSSSQLRNAIEEHDWKTLREGLPHALQDLDFFNKE